MNPQSITPQMLQLMIATKMRELQIMNQYGYSIRHVIDPKAPMGVNAYTNGLSDSMKHPEIQLVLPVSPSDSKAFLNSAGYYIKKNGPLKTNQVYTDIFASGTPCIFVPLDKNTSYKVPVNCIRMILADPNNSLDAKTMATSYAKQWEGVEN